MALRLTTGAWSARAGGPPAGRGLPAGRRPAVALVLALAGWLLAVTAAPPAAAAPAGEPATAGPGPVVVLGVPDLRWQDVDPAGTPTLWRLAGSSSVAALTDRSGEDQTRRATGWVTLNTGSRAVAGVAPGVVPDPAAPAQLEALRTANRAARYAAEIGALGDALHRAGRTVAAVGGPGAALGAVAGDGTVDATAPSIPAALARADVVVVELPQLYEAGRRDAGAVRAALGAIDRQVSDVLAALPGNASLLVAGVSDAAAGPAHLHVAMATGPSFGAGRLTSASTGRTGVVQLIDVGPTVLELVDAPVPTSMLGVHWRTVADPGGAAGPRVAGPRDLDRRSTATLDAVGWYHPAVAGVALLYAAAAVTAWWRQRTALLRPLGAVVAAVPVASWLAQLVPWWRTGTWPLAPLTLGAAALIGAAAASPPWSRGRPWRTAALVAGVTAAVITADAFTGSPLSLDAPFGDNPIIAGRFHGIGNVALALLGAATLVVGAAAATRLPRGRAAAAVVGLGAVAVVVDGAPALGDDFGGVLALLPAVAVLGFVVSGIGISWRHVLAVAAVTVVTTAGFALYDHSRPTAQQTHLGRFVGQVLDGSAGVVVGRKLASSLGTFAAGWGRWIVLGWLVLAVAAVLFHRRGRLRGPAGGDRRVLRGLLAALLVLAVLGAGLNDSGLEIPAFALYLAAPLLAPLLVVVPRPDAAAAPRGPRGAPVPSGQV